MTQPIQRRITLIRHAKAEDDGLTQDHLRALNPRGQEDAAALGAELREAGSVPELFYCSTAQRTRQTLAAFDTNVPTILTDKAYLASAGELLGLLQQADDAVTHIGLVAHNPGLHQLVATLAGEFNDPEDEQRLMLKFPTAACAVLDFEAAGWEALVPQAATLVSFSIKPGNV